MAEEFGSSEAGKKGGKARAEKLTKEQRHEIAIQAAAARWHGVDLESVPKAICEGAIDFGGISVPCAVLADGRRVLSERGVTKGFGLSRAGSNWQRSKDETGARLPIFASANNINSFMDADLRSALSQPILYRPLNAKGAIAYGTQADLIPQVGDAWLKARDAEALTEPQKKVAKVIDLVMRGFAIVGIVALVDEATGYERIKEGNDLAKILEAFVAKQIQKWLRTFDLEFYELICQLRCEPLERAKKRPQYLGKLTNNLVYQRLAPGVLQKLQEVNPVVPETGRRKNQHHRFLTPDMGHPKLKEHLAGVMSAMRFAKAMGVDWDQFLKTLDKTMPKYQPMPLLNGVEDQNGKPMEG